MALRHYSNAKPWLVEFDTQSLRLKQVKYESDKMYGLVKEPEKGNVLYNVWGGCV